MKKVLTSVAFITCLALSAFADRAMPGLWQTKKLADGSEVRVELKGDEHVHFWQTAEGVRYLERDGVLRMASAHEIDSIAYAKRAIAYGDNRAAQARKSSAGSSKVEYVGNKKGLIILVEFKDKAFNMTDAQAYYNRQANEKGFDDGRQKGSVHDYFYAQSDGQFELNFDVVGPVKMLDSYAFYGQDGSNGDIDVNVGSMLVSAINMVSDQVNWAGKDRALAVGNRRVF